MNEPLPLEQGLAALFAEERATHVFSDAMRASVLRGVEYGVLLAPGLGGASSGVAAAFAKGWTTKLVITVAALAFGAGAGVGAIAYRAATPSTQLGPSSTPVASLALTLTDDASVVATVAPAQPLAPSAQPLAPSAQSPAPSAVATTTASVALVPSQRPKDSGAESLPSTLQRERELLDIGQAALARGRAAEALAAANEHSREFPRGRLVQEREVLAIQALRLAGRQSEAQARAALFRKSYPNSIYAGAVEAPKP